MKYEYIKNFVIEYTSDFEATVYSAQSELGLVVTSDEPVRPLVMFLIGIDTIDEYLCRNMEDTSNLELDEVS